jgi:hypothetical protein
MGKVPSVILLFAFTLFLSACGDDEPASKLTNTKLIVEWAPFQLAEGIDEATLIKISAAVQTDFLSKQSGFVKRDLLKGKDNQWVDILYWNSREEAEQAFKNAEKSPACLKYFSLMIGPDPDDPSAGVSHFEQIMTYQ